MSGEKSSLELRIRNFIREPISLGMINFSLAVVEVIVLSFTFSKWRGTYNQIYNKVTENCTSLRRVDQNTSIFLNLTAVAFLWYKFQRYIVGGRGLSTNLKNNTCLKGKIVFVSGANSGVGFETCKQCLLWGATVYMGCRNMALAKEAMERLKAETGSQNVEIFQLDLSDLGSCQNCAKELKAKKQPIEYFVCNAGVMVCPYAQTKQGYEWQFGCNHLGHFCLVKNILPELEKWGSRVIVLSSIAHTWCLSYDGDYPFHLEGEKNVFNVKPEDYNKGRAYAYSKLCNILFVKELQNRFSASSSNATAYALHPGAVMSNLTQHVLSDGMLSNFIFNMLYKTTPRGAATSLHLIASPSENLTPGGYYCDCRCVDPAKEAENQKMIKQLWNKSEELCKVFLSA